MTTYCVLLADAYDIEVAEAGHLVPWGQLRIAPSKDRAKVIGDVLCEIERRWPGYPVEVFPGNRTFAIRQHSGRAGATVALITELPE